MAHNWSPVLFCPASDYWDGQISSAQGAQPDLRTPLWRRNSVEELVIVALKYRPVESQVVLFIDLFKMRSAYCMYVVVD